MFSRFFRKLDNAFRSFDHELQDVFRADGSLQVQSNGLIITEANGHVHIRGELKSLRINGKLARFNPKP